MKVEQLEQVLRNEVDWDDVHRAYALGAWNDSIHIMDDGGVSVHDSGTYFADPEAPVLYTIRASGPGNLDMAYYAEGFADPADAAGGGYGWRVLETGEILDAEVLIERSIQDGDNHDMYEEWIKDAIRAHEEALLSRQ